MRRLTPGASDARFATFVDVEGNPPCDPPDECEVCVLFTGRQPGESRADWTSRITGYTTPRRSHHES